VLSTKSNIIIIFIALLTVLTFLSTINLSTQPVHRTDIYHTDPVGDVQNPDIDIIQIGSYEEEGNIVLVLTVDGIIQNPGKIVDEYNESYRYELIVIAKNKNNPCIHIYRIIYANGQIQNYEFISRTNGDTLRIFFTKDTFLIDMYMVGLEAATYSPISAGAETDTMPLDRDRPIIFR